MDWLWFLLSVASWIVLGSLPALFLAHAFFGQFKENKLDKRQEL